MAEPVHVERRAARGRRLGSLVLVHGGAHAAWCWSEYLPYLAERGWDCHALDWYGHGGSPAVPGAVRRGIADVATEIGIVAAELPEPPVLVGHSMGALAAQCHAAAHPVAGLVLLAPVPPAGVPVTAPPLPVDETRPWGPPPFDVAYGLFFAGLPVDQARDLHARLVPESPRAVLEATGRLPVPVSAAAVRANTPRTLVVAGTEDPLTPPEVTRRVAERYGAEYHLLPGLGHDGLLLGPQWRTAATLVAAHLAS
ncbi:MAG TPA: alpha/beta fold hydrolase [Pseudonocardiaceae bacterium]